MPPCAAMLCARRGLSWKQKHLTLYPSSASVAAAEPAAEHDDVERPFVGRVDQLHLEAVFVPFLSERTAGDFCVEFHGSRLQNTKHQKPNTRQIPGSKLQTPKKSQGPDSHDDCQAVEMELGVRRCFGLGALS